MAPRMTKSKIYSYMRNVGRSFGYAMVDSVSSMNPTVTALFKSTAEQSKDLYESIKNFDGKSLGFESNLKGTLSEGLRDLKNNALDDIRTGKWYNKDRKNAIENQMAEEALGINFDDFGDFDDFNFDDTDLDEQASIQEDATRTTAHAMDIVGSKVSGAVSTAAIKSADYIVESGRLNTKALYNLNLSGFGQVNKGVAAINGNLQLLVSLAEPLTTHMQNSALFYTKSQEYYNESLTLLKQIASNTAPKSSNNYSSSKKSKGYMDYITSEGIIDFAGMLADGGKRIKENTEMITSLMSIVPGGEKAIIKMATASPLQFALTAAIGQLFNVKDSKGRSIRSSFEDFNKVLSNFSVGLLGRMKTAKFGDGLLSPFLRGIRDFLMPNQKTIKKVDPSKYEKGKVDWDGMSRKALMDVIPTQLAQIIALLEGTNDIRVFDYNKGAFVRSSRIAGKYKVDMKNMTNRAGGDLFGYVNKSIDKTNMSTADKRAYKKQVEKLLEYAVMSDDDNFLNFLSDNFDFEKIGMDKRVGRDIQNRVKAISKQKGGKYALSSFAGNVYSARSNVSRYHENPDSSLVSMYNGSFRPTHGSKLIDMKDEFGYSQGEYFRMIISHLSYITKNMKNLVAIPGVGGFNAEGTQIVWEDGDDITKSNHVNSTADGSSDRFKRAGEVRGPLYNDIDSSVAAAMGNDNVGLFDLTEDEKKYEASKGKPGFKFDQEMEDAIKRKKTAQKGLNKAKGFASEAYDRLKGSKVGGILSSIEDRLEMSTENVADALDKMSEGLNRFVYDNKSGLFALMDTMSMGVLSMLKEFIPKPVRDLLGAGWQKFKDSSFGKATFGTLKNIGLSFFGKPGYRSKAESFDPDTRAAAAEQMDFDLEEMGYDRGMFGAGSGLVNNFYSRSRRANFWSNYSRRSFSGSASGIPTFRKVHTIPRGRSYRSRRFSGGASSSGDEEAASGDEEISDPSLKSFFSSIAASIGNKLMDKIAGFTSSIDPKKEKEKVKGTMQKLMEEAGLGKGAIGAGAFIGAGTSLLTGAFLGPIAGAAIGAAVGFVSKSETAQNLLFGKEISDGEGGTKREGGIVPQDISNFIMKHAGSMGKGAGAGVVLGSFAGSPILGAVIGATAGYVSSSEKAKEWIFGKEEDGKRQGGIIPAGLMDVIKKRFPFMATGAGAALLLAPGPLIPKLAIGATLGYIAGEDGGKGLKEWFFGEKDENGNFKLDDKGNEKKGFLGFINEKLFKPMIGTVDKAFNMITKGLKDIITQGTRKIFSMIGGMLQKTKIGQGVLNAGKGLAKVAGGIAHAPVWLAGLPFRAANTTLQRAALRNGTVFRGEDNQYLTSAQRLNLYKVKGGGKNNKGKTTYRETGSSLVDQYLAESYADMTDEEYSAMISDLEAAEKGGDISENATIQAILGKSAHGLNKLKYGDITHALQQARIDKSARDEAKRKKEELEKTPEFNITERIPSLIERVANATDYIAKYLGANIGTVKGNNDKDIVAGDTTVEDSKYDENENLSNSSNAGRAAQKAAGLEVEANESMAEMDDRQKETTDAIKNLTDRLLGKDDEKKETLFDKIKDSLLGAGGLLGGILSFFTGKSTVGAAGSLLTKFPALSTILGVAELGATGGILGAITGLFDDWIAKHGGNGSGNTKEIGSYDEGHSYLYSKDKNGERVELATDEKGNVEITTTEDGTQVVTTLDGQQIPVDEIEDIKSTRTENVQGRSIRRYIAALAVGRGKSATELGIHGVGRVLAGAKQGTLRNKLGQKLVGLSDNMFNFRTNTTGKLLDAVTPKSMKNAANVVGESVEAAEKKLLSAAKESKVATFARELAEHIKELVSKIKKVFGSRMDDTLVNQIDDVMNETVPEMSEKVAKKFATEGTEEVAEGAVKQVPILGWAIAIIDAAWEFEEGWNRAARDFKVTTATTTEKAINGIIEAIISLIGMIPAVGTVATIAGSVLKPFIMDPIIEAMVKKGYMTDLAKRRKESEDEYKADMAAEKAKYGDSYKEKTYDTWHAEKYYDYTWGEKVVNTFTGKANTSKTKQAAIETKNRELDNYQQEYNQKASQGVDYLINGGGASGVISQLDPRYRRYTVGGRSFAYNGCGPASAVMAAGGRLSDAVNIAQKYQTAGGTDAAYFGEMFNRRGMSANYYLAGGSSLIGDIASGKPTVLMGQDVYNTSKANSPFGPNNHYVVANGFDRSGNLLISDPEQRGIRRYNPNILRNVKVGVSGGSSAYAASMQSGDLNTTSTSNSIAAVKQNSYSTPATTKPAMNYNSGSFVPKTSKASSYDDLKADAGKKESIAQKSGKDISSVGLGSPTSGVSNVPMTAENCANGNLGMWSPVTAEEMNSWIASKSSDSPFNGNGEIFIKAAQASGLDPRYILAHAAIESGWGKSNIALTKNNYFGIGAFDTNPSAAYTFAAGASNDGLATGIIEGAKWIADHYYKGKYNQTSVYRMRYNNGVHQYCTSETWVGSIGSIMASGPVNTKLTLDDTPVNLVQNSVDYNTSDVGDNPDEAVKSGAESKVSLGGILSTITSAFANAFGALFNGSSEDGETEHGGSHGTFGEDSGSVNLSGSDPVSYMEGIKGKVKYTFGSHDIENGKGDCSGTVGWAVNKATGLNIGGNTLAMYNNTKNLKSVWYQGGKTSASAPAGAKRNDILLFSRPNSSYTVGRPDRVGHVGLYMGDNKYIHIGQGTGPYESSLNQSANLIKVSRLIDDNGNEINFTGDQEVNYQGVPGATSVHEVYDSEAKSVKKSTAVKSSGKFGSNKITESAMGSGLINYGPSRAGNYILNDTSRNYYKQSGSSSSLSGGASNISFGNLMTTAGNTIRNAYNSAKQRGKDTLSVPTNVASIASDTSDIKKSIAAIAEVLTTIQDAKQNNSTQTNTSTPSRFSDELADSLSELRDVTNSITAV